MFSSMEEHRFKSSHLSRLTLDFRVPPFMISGDEVVGFRGLLCFESWGWLLFWHPGERSDVLRSMLNALW